MQNNENQKSFPPKSGGANKGQRPNNGCVSHAPETILSNKYDHEKKK